MLDCEQLSITNLQVAKYQRSCANIVRYKKQTGPFLSIMKIFKAKPEAGLSDLMSLHQKILVTKSSEDIADFKMDHVPKARNSFSHRKLAGFQSCFKQTPLPRVVHPQCKIKDNVAL